MIDYNERAERLRVIAAIDSDQNTERKKESLKECEIYFDDIRPYVLRYLRTRFNGTTVAEMPIIASVNLAKRIVDEEASIYTNAPTREFTNLTDDQREVAELIYKDMMADLKLMHANRFFRLQDQHHLLVQPVDGKLTIRNYKNHQIDAEENPMNPEKALSYIFTGFDKKVWNDDRNYDNANVNNEVIADEDDYQSQLKRYVIWSKDFHFMMDANGNPVSMDGEEEIPMDNPLSGDNIIPIIDISGLKDYEYFQSYGNSLTDFTVEFNGHLSSLAHVVDLQGFAQAVVKGPADMIPQNLVVGPNQVLRLPTDPESEGADTDFSFANPGSDIAGSQAYIEAILSMYLSSRGADPKVISGTANGQQAFSSGIERLLSMIDKFEASREDISLFEAVEKKLWQIVKAWHNVLRDTDQLDDKYKTQPFPDDSEVQVMFSSPELVTTEKERLEAIEMKRDLGLISQRMAVKEFHGVDDDMVNEIMAEIEGEMNADNQAQNQLLSELREGLGGDDEDSEDESQE